jgi:hypothetical protein
MKYKIFFIILIITSTLLSACTKKNTNSSDNTGKTDNTDAVSTASIVDTEQAFIDAISSTGTWIIAITKDLTVNQDITLEGEFKNGKKDDAGNDIIQRKVALYAQDENRNITARYVLTAPKLTVKSPQASIQHGTFKGDLYVDVDNFALIDATVDGNVFFTKQEYMDSFTMDETSNVTGTKGLQK